MSDKKAKKTKLVDKIKNFFKNLFKKSGKAKQNKNDVPWHESNENKNNVPKVDERVSYRPYDRNKILSSENAGLFPSEKNIFKNVFNLIKSIFKSIFFKKVDVKPKKDSKKFSKNPVGIKPFKIEVEKSNEQNLKKETNLNYTKQNDEKKEAIDPLDNYLGNAKNELENAENGLKNAERISRLNKRRAKHLEKELNINCTQKNTQKNTQKKEVINSLDNELENEENKLKNLENELKNLENKLDKKCAKDLEKIGANLPKHIYSKRDRDVATILNANKDLDI